MRTQSVYLARNDPKAAAPFDVSDATTSFDVVGKAAAPSTAPSLKTRYRVSVLAIKLKLLYNYQLTQHNLNYLEISSLL